MTRAAAPPILLQLQSSESASAQVPLLRTLKNELIGHDQRKETYVAAGIIPALGQLLSKRRPGKASGAEANGVVLNQPPLYQNSDESEACLQAILIAGSLAQGTLKSEGHDDRPIDREAYQSKQGDQHSLLLYSPATSFQPFSPFYLPQIVLPLLLSRSCDS
jgi:hypothetical protein